MKKVINLCAILMLGIMTAFTSCSKDNADVIPEPTPTPTPTPTPEPEPEQKDTAARYTVMFYGCGGTTLDDDLVNNIKQLKAAGNKDSVKFAGLVKFSKDWQTKGPEYSGTRYLSWDKDSLHSDKKYEAGYRLDNPANLTAFIKETAKAMPAHKYILVFWDHGSEFGMGDKLVQDSYPEGATRACLEDDNISESNYTSIFEIEKAIKDAGIKMELIYFDCCLTGMVETNYQLKDCAHYIMNSFEVVPGLGGDYTLLMNNLQDKPSLEEAIKDYVPKTVENWKKDSVCIHDLTCYDMTYMDELKERVKSYTDHLSKSIQSTEVAKLMYFSFKGDNPNGYFFSTRSPSNISAEMVSSFNRLAYLLNDETLTAYAKEVESTMDRMTVAQANFKNENWLSVVRMGINWPSLSNWVYYHDTKWNRPVYKTALDNSAFLKETGWINILSSFPDIYDYTGFSS